MGAKYLERLILSRDLLLIKCYSWISSCSMLNDLGFKERSHINSYRVGEWVIAFCHCSIGKCTTDRSGKCLFCDGAVVTYLLDLSTYGLVQVRKTKDSSSAARRWSLESMHNDGIGRKIRHLYFLPICLKHLRRKKQEKKARFSDESPNSKNRWIIKFERLKDSNYSLLWHRPNPSMLFTANKSA